MRLDGTGNSCSVITELRRKSLLSAVRQMLGPMYDVRREDEYVGVMLRLIQRERRMG